MLGGFCFFFYSCNPANKSSINNLVNTTQKGLIMGSLRWEELLLIGRDNFYKNNFCRYLKLSYSQSEYKQDHCDS